MSTPEIIDITLTNNSPLSSPKLSVVGNSDAGMIRLNNLPPLETNDMNKKSVNFGPCADLLMNPSHANKQNSPKSDIKLSDLNALDLDDKKEKSTICLVGQGCVLKRFPNHSLSLIHISESI